MSVATADPTKATRIRMIAKQALGRNPTREMQRKAQAYVHLRLRGYDSDDEILKGLGIRDAAEAAWTISEIEEVARERGMTEAKDGAQKNGATAS